MFIAKKTIEATGSTKRVALNNLRIALAYDQDTTSEGSVEFVEVEEDHSKRIADFREKYKCDWSDKVVASLLDCGTKIGKFSYVAVYDDDDPDGPFVRIDNFKNEKLLKSFVLSNCTAPTDMYFCISNGKRVDIWDVIYSDIQKAFNITKKQAKHFVANTNSSVFYSSFVVTYWEGSKISFIYSYKTEKQLLLSAGTEHLRCLDKYKVIALIKGEAKELDIQFKVSYK